MQTIAARSSAAFASLLTQTAALAVSCLRPLVRHKLTEEECEAAGLPLGSTVPAVHVLRVVGSPWWRLGAWADRTDPTGGSLHLRLLGWEGEVYYWRRAANT